MIRTCSAKIIPVLWLSAAAAAWQAPATTTPNRPASAGNGSLTALARAWRESPTPAHGAALEAFAKAHASEAAGALARLALGVTAYEQKDYAGALEHLKGLSARLPQIADYVAYYQGAARVESATELDFVGRDLALVHRSAASADEKVVARSPLAGRAWILEARALKPGQPAEAVRLLREHYAELPQPEGDINLADCYQAAGDLPRAADFYQRVYYQRISGDAAARATAALLALKDSLGAAYPQPLPEQMLRHADLLLEAHEYPEARTEYETLTGQLVDLERDQARVRLGAADFLRGNTAAACEYLRGLEMAESEADAERLFYLEECTRRLTDEDAMMAALKRLGSRYPHSPWRLRALLGAANRYLVTNRTEELAPLDKAIWEDFPHDPPAAQSHWRIAFRAYLEDKSDAPDLLREHLEKFPAHATAGAALYFLGRGAEREQALAEASAFYNQLAKALPNTYYAMLARERLSGTEWKAVIPAPQVQEFLATLHLPTAKPVPLETSAATTVRIERSRLLRTAGLGDLADAELRFGARTDGQPALLAMEMATSADAPYQGLKAMKSLNSDYLNLPFGGAPEKFWKFLFPMPYREELIASANTVDLDPYLVAGLIRQESEFNPEAISRANAYGLTQVRPVTGREFARRAGVPHFTNRVLFEPSVNLKIGAAIFRSMLDKHNGNLVETLAAYNAGPARAAQWISWSTYREPAEFVESIPFTETRDYVQSVLRNADIYRRLYK